MGVIIIHQDAVPANSLKADLQVSVNATDNVAKKINELVFAIDQCIPTAVPGYYNELHIYCNSTDIGLSLGSGVDHNNITEIFRPLRFKVGNIILHSESAALIYKNGNNGVLMCKRLGNAVYANVTATASVAHVNMNDYRGNRAVRNMHGVTTATWNQAGKIVVLRENDEAGVNRSLGLGNMMNYKLTAKPAVISSTTTAVKSFGSLSGNITGHFQMHIFKYILALRYVMAITGRG